MTVGPTDRGHGDRPLCGGDKRQGEGTCTQAAGWGTDHPGVGRCKLHGGSTPSHRAAAQREIAEQALVQATRTYGVPVDVEPGEALLGLVRTTAGIVKWLGDQVAQLDEQQATGDSPRAQALLARYLDERKELARVSKDTLAAGVAERRVRLAESQGQLIVGVLEAFAHALGHDPQDGQVRAAARQALLTIDGELG